MTFVTFQAGDLGTDFSFEGRNEAAGILGVFHSGEVPPVLTANTLDELERETRAYLGNEPNAVLYLTDGNGYVYRIMMNEKHHTAIERARRQTVTAVSLLVFSVTCLPAAVGLGTWAVFAFVGVAGVYGLFLRAGPYNEIEAAFVCEILLILALFLISQLQGGDSVAAEPSGAADHGQIATSQNASVPARFRLLSGDALP